MLFQFPREEIEWSDYLEDSLALNLDPENFGASITFLSPASIQCIFFVDKGDYPSFDLFSYWNLVCFELRLLVLAAYNLTLFKLSSSF